ncbi:MAG: V-type ATPase subunit [Candidatus Omnitrophota bacterium]|nr:V-type ATPase subunit [Candidatus Omnitrophota bacterium]
MYDLAKYSFANAKIRAMLSRLLHPDEFSRLLDATSIDDVLESLKNTPYAFLAEHFSGNSFNLRAIEKALIKNDIALYRKVCGTITTRRERDFLSLLTSRYEIEELKAVLRIWHNKRDVNLDEYLLGDEITHPLDYRKILACQTIEEIILLLDETAYKRPLMDARDRYKEKNASFYLEAALDRDYYVRARSLIENLSSTDKRVALRILGIEIDIENINWLIRLRKYYVLGIGEMLPLIIPGGEKITTDVVRNFYATDGVGKVVDAVALGPYARIKELVNENVAFVESFLYEILLREVRRTLAGFPFTIGTVLGYLILKNRETRNIVSLLYGKNYGFGRDTLLSLMHFG